MTLSTVIGTPFTPERAARKVQMAEDVWNSRGPERVALAYSPDSEWRNRTVFHRIAVRLEYEWHDARGQ